LNAQVHTVSASVWHNLFAAAELLAGFVIVMLTLLILWGLTELMGRLVTRFESRPPQAAAPVAAGHQAPPAAADADEELAVIAAAVALMLSVPHRVVQVQPRPSSWGHKGRSDLHDSHRIR
jgi:sodium pump decarboxylase gamma subunit